MLFARSHSAGPRVRPTPGATATCATCGAACTAKCGSVNVWHWAHVSRADCDPWSEGETAWHAGWKALAEDHAVEVAMGPHRADIVTNRGTVIELQHSAISAEEIADRETFYGPELVWVFDGAPFFERFLLRPRDGFHTFRWLTPRRSLFAVRRPVFFDFGPHLFEVKKLHSEVPCGGWGKLHKKHDFLARAGLQPLANPRVIGRVDIVAQTLNSDGWPVQVVTGSFLDMSKAAMFVLGFDTSEVRRAFYADGGEASAAEGEQAVDAATARLGQS